MGRSRVSPKSGALCWLANYIYNLQILESLLGSAVVTREGDRVTLQGLLSRAYRYHATNEEVAGAINEGIVAGQQHRFYRLR